jgi:multiple sugar transport system substrate-binding protein
MEDERTQGARLSRERFLAMSASAGAGVMLLGACGGGDSAADKVESEQAGGGASKGGSQYSGPNVTLAFWNGFTGGDGPYMRKMVKQFNSEHDNIKVNMAVQEWGDYYAKVPAAVSSGKGPDVGIMHIDQLATNAARNVIIPLDDVAESLKLEEGDFIPAVWQGGIYQDKRYGIPLDTHMLAFYYNKELMQKAGLGDKPPATRDEFEAALKALKGKANVANPFWAPATWPAHLITMSLIWQNGGDLTNEDGTEAAFNSDAGVEGLTWLKSMQEQGFSPKNVAPDSQYTAFKAGKNAFTWDGIWQINDLKKTDLQWDAAPLPQIGSEKAVWASSHNFVVMRSRNTDENKLEASKTFINWISAHSLEWARSGQVPARNSVRDSAGFKKLQPQATLAQQTSYVHFPPALPGWGDVQHETLELAVQEAMLGKKDPKKALDDAAKKAQGLLKENASKYGG